MNTRKIYPSYFGIPAVIIYSIFCFLPGTLGLGYSFTDWNSYSQEINFIGLDNYKEIFLESAKYKHLIGNTLVFTLITTITKTVMAVLLALLLTNVKVKGRNLHRTVAFMPQVLSYLIVGLVFRSMLHPTTGFINVTLDAVGLEGLARKWLTDLDLAFYSVMFVDTWKGMGYVMMVVIAGLNSISDTYYEAASIDGASYYQKFIRITIPLLRPVFLNITILSLTYGLRVFDIVYSLTGGGPGYATGVISTGVYEEFSKGNYAMGTTLSSIIFIVVALLSYFIIKSMENKEVES